MRRRVKKHIEHEQQQKEVNLQSKGTAITMHTEKNNCPLTASQDSRAMEYGFSMSGVEPQASDGKVLVDANTDEQGTVDDLCGGSSTNVSYSSEV